jgi:hypothetical protein
MESDPRTATLKRNFILQQGLSEASAASCPAQYSSLHFQPRILGVVVLVAVMLQDSRVFLALAGVLWWSALVPRLNPFDALYNWTIAVRPGRVALPPAPPPRRFAQGMAGTFALGIGISLALGWNGTAHVLEGMLIVALAALVLGGFCLGSFVFHLLRGRATFARRTLPWARGA